jgi:DNA invertase Pin-like site-specific DNA recombinase
MREAYCRPALGVSFFEQPRAAGTWLELGKERRAASREARVARGLAATKPMKLDAAQQKRLLRLYQHGEPVSELTTLFGISRSTLFRTLKVLKQQPAPA